MPENMREQLALLNEQSLQLYRQGEYGQAIALAIQLKEKTRQHLGEQDPDFATSLNNLAGIYEALGDYSAALQLYRQAVEIYRTTLGEEDPTYAVSLSNLGGVYEAMGNYTATEPLYRQALYITRTALGEDHPDFAASLNDLALFYKKIGNYAAAEILFKQAVEIYRRYDAEDPDFARSLNNLAGLYEVMEKYEISEPLYRQALQITRDALGDHHPEVATCLNNLAFLYESIGEYEMAEPLYKQALNIRRTIFGKYHPDVADSLNNIAELCRAMGNDRAAEPLLQQVLTIRRKALGADHPSVAQSLNNLAGLYVTIGNITKALDLMKEAAVIDDRMIGQVFSIGSESQRMAYIATLSGHFYAFLSLVRVASDHSLTVLSGLDLVLRRKAIGAEVLAAQRDAILSGRYPALEPKLHELTILRRQIAQKTLAGPDQESPDIQKKLLVKLNAKKEKLEAELAHQIPEMNLEQKLRSADRKTVAKALPKDAVLIEFVRLHIFDFKAVPAQGEQQWKPAHYLAFILPAEEPDNAKIIDLGEAGNIENMINVFRTSITGEAEGRHVMPAQVILDKGSGKTAYRSDGNELRAAIFDPLIDAFGGHKRLFLAPDGDLSRLPFEVLPTGDDRYLIDDYRISYISVGRDVLRFKATSVVKPNSPLVIADPDFDLVSDGTPTLTEDTAQWGRRSRDSSALHFGRLPGTRIEGEKVASMLGVQPLLEGNVLETWIKACRSPQILHIATHGFFLPDQKGEHNKDKLGLATINVNDKMGRLSYSLENPLLRSGLALAGANTWLRGKPLPFDAEDGILTAEDVSGMDLLGTKMVVLSACETGLGEVQVGEGIFGLRRTFVLAGAMTLVMSLWKVPDEQTQELMVDFYRYILSGHPSAEALCKAQLAMKEKYPNPYYWGAFICQGNPGPLT